MGHRFHSALWLKLLALAMLLGLNTSTPGAQPSKTLILAVHPYLPLAEIYTRFTPLAEYLTQKTGLPITVRVGSDYEEHIATIGRDQVDIAFMGPAPYVRMTDKFGAKPLLARFEVNHEPNLYGVIFTPKDSSIQSLADLKGKRFAFGDPESTMSHIVPRYMMRHSGVPVTSLAQHQFLGSHKNVALGVLAGDFDAGAVKQEVFIEFEPKGLRALEISPPISDHVFVTRSNLPLDQISALRQAMQALKNAPQGPTILNALHKGMTALVEVKDSDYDNLRPMVREVTEQTP